MAFHAVVVSIMELDISIEITLSILWPGLLQECCEPSVFDFCLFYHDYAENFESLRFRAGKVGINPILSDPSQRGVSSVPFPFRFPFQLHYELVSSLLALDATELVTQPLTQTVVEMINIHVISVQQKR